MSGLEPKNLNPKLNRWTVALACAGVIGVGATSQAEEAAHQVLTALSSTTLSGYVSTSAIWKFGSGNGLIGRSFDGTAKQDGINLDVVKLSLEKPIDQGQWSAGYKVDLLFGPDAIAYNSPVGPAGDFGFKQAYVALRAPVGNGIDFKIGSFDTCVGYEGFDAPANPNYSRSFAYFLEPLAHTGVLASYQLCEFASVSAGVANTYMTGVNVRSTRGESNKALMGIVTLTAPESLGFLKGATLNAGVVDGFAGSADRDTTLYYVGATMPTPLPALALGAAFDYRTDAPAVAPLGLENRAYAVAGYASFTATEKLKLNARVEYANADDGTYYDRGGALSSKRNKLLGSTLTADYSLWANVMTRAEVRWDHSLAADKPFGVDDRNAISLAANIIYRF